MAKLKKVKGSNGLLAFFCPACHRVHEVCIDRRDWPNLVWQWNGNKDKPTFSPSILELGEDKNGKTRCHTFVRDGEIHYLSDCTHGMASKTVDMVDIPENYGGLEDL